MNSSKVSVESMGHSHASCTQKPCHHRKSLIFNSFGTAFTTKSSSNSRTKAADALAAGGLVAGVALLPLMLVMLELACVSSFAITLDPTIAVMILLASGSL